MYAGIQKLCFFLDLSYFLPITESSLQCPSINDLNEKRPFWFLSAFLHVSDRLPTNIFSGCKIRIWNILALIGNCRCRNYMTWKDDMSKKILQRKKEILKDRILSSRKKTDHLTKVFWKETPLSRLITRRNFCHCERCCEKSFGIVEIKLTLETPISAQWTTNVA